MLRANERERDGDGGEVSAGMRYPLLMPCTLPRALVDINGGTGKKVSCHTWLIQQAWFDKGPGLT